MTNNIGWLRTVVHEPTNSRPCVHTLTRPPNRFIVSKKVVARLNYQSRVLVQNPACIAARIGETLIIGFDKIGPISGCSMKAPKPRIAHRFDYQLTPVEGRDDILLAVR